jgi:DTW domain-containing protein YfiP
MNMRIYCPRCERNANHCKCMTRRLNKDDRNVIVILVITWAISCAYVFVQNLPNWVK